jgi:biotin carboxyl carrier protein
MMWQILVNGRAVEIDTESLDAVTRVEPGVYSVLLDGESFEVRVVPGAQSLDVEVDGRRFQAEVRDPRNANRRSREALGAGRQNIAAPMPGKVIRVLVHEDDTIEAGQGVVVVEAMKMQNEMKAARPGRVVEIRVRDGDTVGAGDTLVVLE